MAERPGSRSANPSANGSADRRAAERHAGRGVAGPQGQAVALEAALRPLVERLGAEFVRGNARPGDVPVEWEGQVAFHVRLAAEHAPPEPVAPDLSDGLSRLIAGVEQELGGPLAELSRSEKQHAVRLLEERGAFELRRAAETVAEALGLTRFTVYNYLNRVREQG